MAHVGPVHPPGIVRRQVARAILLDPLDRVLLFYLDPSLDPHGRGYWYLPGGGIGAGESPEVAVIRELREEAGIDTAELGPRLAHLRGVRFQFAGQLHEQDEWHIVARAGSETLAIATAGDVETDAVAAHRWWSVEDLALSEETIYPAHLQAVLRDFLAEGAPDLPLEIHAPPAP